MMTCQWSKHADAIESARERGRSSFYGEALAWAQRTKAPELSEYLDAIVDSHRAANQYSAAAMQRAIDILLDAYFQAQEGGHDRYARH